MIRMDHIFSYWIFIWFIFYLFGFIKYNPKFAIMVGIIENIMIMIAMIYMNTSKKLLLLFFIMFLILKMIPFMIIKNTIINTNDIGVTFMMFILYLCWMFINGKSFYDFYNQTIDLVLYNKNTLPGMNILNNLNLF
jgi:hypothetical protein